MTLSQNTNIFHIFTPKTDILHTLQMHAHP